MYRGEPPFVDPRSEFEFKHGHIPGAINAPVRKILLNGAHLLNVVLGKKDRAGLR